MSARPKGCFKDSSSRALELKSLTDPDMSIVACAKFCGAYKYFGVENGQECYCGNTLPTVPGGNKCYQKCSGSNEICGGPWALSVFESKFFLFLN